MSDSNAPLVPAKELLDTKNTEIAQLEAILQRQEQEHELMTL